MSQQSVVGRPGGLEPCCPGKRLGPLELRPAAPRCNGEQVVVTRERSVELAGPSLEERCRLQGLRIFGLNRKHPGHLRQRPRDVSRPSTYSRPGQASVKVAGLQRDQAIEQFHRRIVLLLPRQHERDPQ